MLGQEECSLIIGGAIKKINVYSGLGELLIKDSTRLTKALMSEMARPSGMQKV